MQTVPKVGQYLYATCSAQDYGKILRVGKDENDVDCIDIEINHPDDLIIQDENDGVGFGSSPLTTIELPKDVKIILRNVQYKNLNYDWAYCIECNTPGRGCYRCTKSFVVNDKPREEENNKLLGIS